MNEMGAFLFHNALLSYKILKIDFRCNKCEVAHRVMLLK